MLKMACHIKKERQAKGILREGTMRSWTKVIYACAKAGGGKSDRDKLSCQLPLLEVPIVSRGRNTAGLVYGAQNGQDRTLFVGRPFLLPNYGQNNQQNKGQEQRK